MKISLNLPLLVTDGVDFFHSQMPSKGFGGHLQQTCGFHVFFGIFTPDPWGNAVKIRLDFSHIFQMSGSTTN